MPSPQYDTTRLFISPHTHTRQPQCTLTSNTQQGHLWRPSQRPRLSSAECCVISPLTTLASRNTHCCCSSARKRRAEGALLKVVPEKQRASFQLRVAALCFVCRQVTHTGEKSSRPPLPPPLHCLSSHRRPVLLRVQPSCFSSSTPPPRTVPSRCPDVTVDKSHAH